MTYYNQNKRKLPDEVIDEIIAEWNKGISSGKLGAKHNMSRNAIIGIVHRARLRGMMVRVNLPALGNAKRKHKPRKWVPKDHTAKPKKVEPDVKPIIQVSVPAAQQPWGGWLLWEMNDKQCRWSDSDGRTRPYQFCGKPGFPWCPEHHKRVYTKVPAATGRMFDARVK